MKIGILGASGFIGGRTVEMLHAKGMDVRPIVRTHASFSRLSPNLDGQIANALDQAALQAAFKGCDVVIHSVLGNPGLIRSAVAPAYRAAEKAGVRRLIYMSSMCVHSQAPAPGTTEETLLHQEQPFPYNTAKIAAEQKLLQLRKSGSVEVVIFRPGVVFGPHSVRVLDLAEQLLQGTACLADNGRGICNTVYIDNLVHAIWLALAVEAADREAFFVGDREVVTWLDFYSLFAKALDVDMSQVHQVAAPKLLPSQASSFSDRLRESVFFQKLTSTFSDGLKQRIKQLLPSSVTLEEQLADLQPTLSPEMVLLQQSQYKLPCAKANKILGYEPIVSFQDGCQRSIDWLSQEIHLKSKLA